MQAKLVYITNLVITGIFKERDMRHYKINTFKYLLTISLLTFLFVSCSFSVPSGGENLALLNNLRKLASSGTLAGVETLSLNTSNTGEYLVIRELSQTSVIKRGIDSKNTILSNYTVIDIYSYGNPIIKGNPVVVAGTTATNYFISDALALILLDSVITINSTNTNFIKVKSDLSVDKAADGIISDFFITKNGVFVKDGTNTYFVKKLDNSKIQITNNPSLSLENLNNDLIFSNGTALRSGTSGLSTIVSSVTSLDTILNQGNYVVFKSNITGSNKIYDSISLVNYSIQSCNGPQITYLSSSFAHINDCQSSPILNMSSGVRSSVISKIYENFNWNGDTIPVSDGGLGICSISSGVYGICHLEPNNKVLTKIINSSISPASTTYGKTKLISTKNYFFFLGEKSGGSVVAGKYDVTTGSTTEFNHSGTPVKIQGF